MNVLARPEVVLGGSWGPLDRAMRTASSKLDRAGAKFERLGARFSVGLTLPLAGVGTAAARATASWETALVGVRKTVDATVNQIDALGHSLVRMSERIPVASGDLAGIAEEAGQLGIATENLRGFVETVASLKVATNLGEQAGSTLARLANIMGTSQKDFGRMGSTIVDLGNNLATTEAEIADMALRIAGAGSQIGLTEAQVLSFAGALSSVGVRSEAGGTAISRVMVDIATAVEQGGSLLQRFSSIAGMTVDDFRTRFETDAAGAIAAFISGLGELEGQGRSTFSTLEELGLADIRVRDVLLRASAASDIFTEALDRGTRAWEENTALSREASLFFGRLAARFKVLKNKAANVTAELGDALRPAFDRVLAAADGVLNIFRELVRRFAVLDPQIRTQVALWAGIAAAIGPVSVALGTVLALFGSVLGTIASVGLALTGLVAIILAVRNNWLGLGEAGARAWDTIVGAADTALGAIVGVVKPIANFLIGVLAGFARAAVLSWDIIRYEFQRAFGKIRDFYRPILTGLATALSVVGSLGASAAAKIREVLAGGEEEGREGGTRIGREIAAGFAEAFGTDYVGAFADIVRSGIERARQLIADAIARLREFAGGDAGVPELEELEQSLAKVGETLDGATEGAAAGFNIMRQALVDLKAAAIDFTAAFADTLGAAVTDGVEAFKRFGEYVLATLARIAARLVIFKALSAVFPGSQFVKGLGSAFGFAGAFAGGGHIPAGMFGLTGEAGMELVTRPTLVAGPANVTPVTGGGLAERVEFTFPPMRSPTDMGRDPEIARMILATLGKLEDDGWRPS